MAAPAELKGELADESAEDWPGRGLREGLDQRPQRLDRDLASQRRDECVGWQLEREEAEIR